MKGRKFSFNPATGGINGRNGRNRRNLTRVVASTRINGCKRRLKLAATGFKTGPGLSLNNELGFNLKVILYKRYLHQVRSKNL
jgi:hypothetical protein